MSKTIINESVSINDISDVMDNHRRVIINYRSDGKDEHTGARVVEIYAYGLTKAGNPVIRGFQPYGDTTSTVPRWKFFRLDRIIGWKPTNQTFNRPASFYYKGLGDFNPNGDETMSVVYKITKFEDEEGNTNNVVNVPTSSPKTKSDSKPFKTDTEHKMERLRQQLDNPITLSDLKAQEISKLDKSIPKQQNGPRTKEVPKQQETEPYKTDTEKGIENLRKQLENPITLSDYMKNQGKTTEKSNDNELKDLRQKLGDTTKPIPFSELNKRLNTTNEPYKTDTEKGIENLRKQLENPKKIDLSRIPKK